MPKPFENDELLLEEFGNKLLKYKEEASKTLNLPSRESTTIGDSFNNILSDNSKSDSEKINDLFIELSQYMAVIQENQKVYKFRPHLYTAFRNFYQRFVSTMLARHTDALMEMLKNNKLPLSLILQKHDKNFGSYAGRLKATKESCFKVDDINREQDINYYLHQPNLFTLLITNSALWEKQDIIIETMSELISQKILNKACLVSQVNTSKEELITEGTSSLIIPLLGVMKIEYRVKINLLVFLVIQDNKR